MLLEEGRLLEEEGSLGKSVEQREELEGKREEEKTKKI